MHISSPSNMQALTVQTPALWATPANVGREHSSTGWSCPGRETKGSLAPQTGYVSADGEKWGTRTQGWVEDSGWHPDCFIFYFLFGHSGPGLGHRATACLLCHL